MKVLDAKNQKIFVLNYDNANYKDASNLENRISIEETNYYDWVYVSVDETTTPRGVAPRDFAEEWEDIVIRVQDFSSSKNIEMIEGRVKGNTWRFDSFLNYLDLDILEKEFEKISNDDAENFGYDISDDVSTSTYYKGTIYEIMSWGVGGNNLRSEETFFLSRDETDDYLFEKVEHSFNSDDQRDTCYYSSYEEAEERRLEVLSEWWNCSEETAKSIIKHQEKADNIKAEKQRIAFIKQRKEEERINSLASIYANMIHKVEGEEFEGTVKRLGSAIGERIEKKVFYKAVKLIRNK